ncbi:MAG: C4-dicarboxylate ABC transporter substrate-binding protein, partial [Geminicoccaceae bacterium]
MRPQKIFAGTAAAALGLGLAIGSAHAQDTIILHGASQFNEEHAFTRAMVRFQELVQEYYDGDVEFVMHLNSELGLEKQYFEYMSQGTSVDFAIVSPAHMST